MQRLDWSVFSEGRDFLDSHFACHSGLLTQVEMQIFSHQEPGSTRNVSSTIKCPLEPGPKGLAVVLMPQCHAEPMGMPFLNGKWRGRR